MKTTAKPTMTFRPARRVDRRRGGRVDRRRGDRARNRLRAKTLRAAWAMITDAENVRHPGTDKSGHISVPFSGRAGYVEAPPMIQGTSHQVAGFFPFLASVSRPVLGAPLGTHFNDRSPVFYDLMTLFLSKGASSPSMVLFGLQGRGKSSFFLRMCLGMVDSGFLLVFPGDLKGEYTGLIRAIGGEVIEVGPGKDCINPMDAGPLEHMISQIQDPELRDMMDAEMRTRRHNTCIALLELVLKRELDVGTGEDEAFTTAIDQAAAEHGSAAVLGHVMARLDNPDADLLRSARCSTKEEFASITKPLLHGLDKLINGAEFGGTFSRPTSRTMPVGISCSFDISSVPVSQTRYRAALQVVTWAYSQSVTSAVMTLHQAGLWPETHYVMGFDELWQVFQVNPRVAVYMLEELIRVNRTKGIGQALITHGTGDFQLPDPDLTARAKKFIARSSMRVYGGIDHDEIDILAGVQKFTRKEKALLSAWSADSGAGGVPPGRGKFLMKFGDEPGIPINMGEKTAYEHSLHNTNTAFESSFAAFANAA